MKNIIRYIYPLVAVLMAVSCIENDLSYPYAPADIVSFSVEGQKSVTVDKENHTVEIVLEEKADMANVRILDWSFANGAEVVGGMPEYLDLRKPVRLVLRVYEDSEWTISASQPIERYIRCENQVGEAVFDLEEKTAYVYVSISQPLTDVKFTGIKLEPEGCRLIRTEGFIYDEERRETIPEIIENIDFPIELDCVQIRYFYVEYKGETIKWFVKVLQKQVGMEVKEVNPWACFAGIKGTATGQGVPALEYRKSADSQWIEYEDITVSGTNVTAELRGLEPETEYVVRLVNGEERSSEVKFTTSKAEQLENSGFDDWYMNDKKAWMPNPNSNIQIWDTANPGSAPLGLLPTVPEENIVVKGKAAKMVTAEAPIIKMLAAGNIYTGKFDSLKGLGAELDWGVPFGARPLALRGYYKYEPQIINVGKDPDYAEYMGQLDQCQIQIFLAEWDKPFHVNSSKKQFVDRNDRSVIAFSEFYTDEENAEYKRFSLPIVYNDNRIPTYIVISACSSRFGNYFVGGIGSLLYVDEFELVYDPDELTPEEYATVFSKVKPI